MVLNKEEKRKILLSLCDVENDEVMSFVTAKVSEEKHIISECTERKTFWESLQSSSQLVDLLSFFGEAFVSLYKSLSLPLYGGDGLAGQSNWAPSSRRYLQIHHVSFFCTLACDKGKEKFMRFQLEWHKMCSVFLLAPSNAIEESGWSPTV